MPQRAGDVLHYRFEAAECRVEEGHLMPDHRHMLLSIPPKDAVSQVVGFIKGKSAIHLARDYGERKRNFVVRHFRACIKNQEQEDQRLDQLGLCR